jgi:hypothetical protein
MSEITEEQVNTVKISIMKKIVNSFFDDLDETYYLDEAYAREADTLLKSLRSILDN